MKSGRIIVSLFVIIFSLLTNISFAVDSRKLDFTIIDKADSQPVAGVELEIRVDDNEFKAQTDSHGLCAIDIPAETPGYVAINVKHEHYVPTKVTWRNSDSKMVIPDDYLLRLEKGTTIGGIIQNEDGQPIEWVKVNLLVPGDGEIERCSIWDYEVLTDAQGKWQCDIMPSELKEVWIKLAHDDYVSDVMYGMTPKPSMDKLRDMTGIMVLKRGLTVEGYVKDTQGQPIAGADVVQGSDRHGSDYPMTTTNNEGYYKFVNCAEGTMILTVSVPDGMGSNRSCEPEYNPTPRAKEGLFYAPDLREINVVKDLGQINFELEKGNVIRGRVFDTDGNPLKDIPIAADTWRGHRSISWHGKTDTDGCFSWNSAPSDAVLYDLYPRYYMSIRKHSMVAGDEEHSLTMIKTLEVHGTITDSETGELIKNATLTRGIVWSEDRPKAYWELQQDKVYATDGSYMAYFDFPRYGHKLLAEAEGYLPQESRIFKDDEGKIEIKFALEKGASLTGKILLPDGSPAENVEIAIAVINSPANITGRYFQNRDCKIYKTDIEGHFNIPPQLDDFKLAVVHEQGYATVAKDEFENSNFITLTQWASVKGRLFIGGEPGGIQKVSARINIPWDGNKPQVYFRNDMSTDLDGNFEFKYLPAGNAIVCRGISISERTTSYSNGMAVVLEPGKETYVTVGGIGRPVKGRFTTPADYGKDIQLVNCHDFRITLQKKLPELPAGYQDLPDDQKKQCFEKWTASEEYLKAVEDYDSKPHSYTARIESDGSFVADDMADGSYVLNMDVYKPNGDSCDWSKPFGAVNKEFIIEPMANGRSDEALDLGDMVIKIKKSVDPGSPAPAFTAKDLDGKEVKLSDYAGKYVLLDFWATWCGPCIGEVPNLKAAYEKYNDSGKLYVLSFSFDKNVDIVKKKIEAEGVKWSQCIDTAGFNSDAAAEYGIRGIPAIFLISPEGKIVATGLRGEAIMQELDKHLK